MSDRKMSVCVDFDGTVHSYTSGWKGATVIPDPPIPGALAWLQQMTGDGRFEVCIYSSRSKEPGAIEAMKGWFLQHFTEHFISGGMGVLDSQEWAGRMVNRLSFPTQKPAAIMTVDDRAFCFEGVYPTPDWIANFRPWNKR